MNFILIIKLQNDIKDRHLVQSFNVLLIPFIPLNFAKIKIRHCTLHSYIFCHSLRLVFVGRNNCKLDTSDNCTWCLKLEVYVDPLDNCNHIFLVAGMLLKLRRRYRCSQRLLKLWKTSFRLRISLLSNRFVWMINSWKPFVFYILNPICSFRVNFIISIFLTDSAE